jgi:spore maturation protein CgeB
LPELFRVGEEIAVFKTVDELKGKIRYYLEREEERAAMAAKARERALREHTFEHRMREMLVRIYGDCLPDLKTRVDARLDGVDYLIEQAGSGTELGEYLKQFKNADNFSMKTITDRIAKGEEALTGNELLLLMVDQVVKEAD